MFVRQCEQSSKRVLGRAFSHVLERGSHRLSSQRWKQGEIEPDDFPPSPVPLSHIIIRHIYGIPLQLSNDFFEIPNNV